MRESPFDDYLNLLKILIWPGTVLLALFFFRKIVTYLFFSMDGFNFFGAKGNLRKVDDVIKEEVKKRFLEEKREKKRESRIAEKEAELNKMTEDSLSLEEAKKIVRGVIDDWKKSDKELGELIRKLLDKNKRLKKTIIDISSKNNIINKAEVAIDFSDNEAKTSDPPSEESSEDKLIE